MIDGRRTTLEEPTTTTMLKWELLRMRRRTKTTTLVTSQSHPHSSSYCANDRRRYSDDDDTSWKVRRAATKLLSACIATRSDLLASFYRTISPALIERFSEREETVKVEIWSTFTTLLLQTKVFGTGISPAIDAASPNGTLKRKRSSDKMEIEEG